MQNALLTHTWMKPRVCTSKLFMFTKVGKYFNIFWKPFRSFFTPINHWALLWCQDSKNRQFIHRKVLFRPANAHASTYKQLWITGTFTCFYWRALLSFECTHILTEKSSLSSERSQLHFTELWHKCGGKMLDFVVLHFRKDLTSCS